VLDFKCDDSCVEVRQKKHEARAATADDDVSQIPPLSFLMM